MHDVALGTVRGGSITLITVNRSHEDPDASADVILGAESERRLVAEVVEERHQTAKAAPVLT